MILNILDQIEVNKKRLGELRPLESQSVLHALDVEYTYESNRIEGNTLTLNETALVIDKGLTVGGKSMREHLEAINHYEAVLFLRDIVHNKVHLTESLVKQLHGLILRGIDRENAGVYRKQVVAISGSRHIPPPPTAVQDLMEKCFEWFEENKLKLHPVILAAEMHERIVTIHPFIDGNGRTSRLVMNLLLLQNSYPIANISGSLDSRRAYYDALEKCNLGESKDDFIALIAQEVYASMLKLLKIAGE